MPVDDRPAGPPRIRPIRWLGSRAVLLHVALLVAIPVCAICARWQVSRALSGNTLSWLYVLEWPAFAALSVWLWWVLLSAPSRNPATGADTEVLASRPDRLASRRTPPLWAPDDESPDLRQYNDFLRRLAEGSAQLSQRPAKAPWTR